MLRPYRELAAVPRVPGLLTWSMLGRLHLTGTPLAMSFLIAGWTGSYTVAGVVGAALMAGFGVAGPLRGRAADRRGAAGLIIVTGVGYGVGLTGLAFLPGWLPAGWWPAVAVAAFTVGLSNPPVAPVSRASWPRLIEGPALNSIYTVEATLVELLYVVGPILAATVVAVLDPAAAILLTAVLATFGALGFARSLRLAGLAGPVPSSAGKVQVGLLTAPGILAALGVSVCLVAALLTVDMTLIGWSRDSGLPILAGILGGVWATGSALGGFLAGGLAGQPRLTFRMTLNLIGIAALVPLLPPIFDPASPWLVGVVLFVGGAAISPAVAAANARLGELAPPERRAEAYGWLASATTAGFAVALPMSGYLLDHGGPAVSAASAFVLAVAAVLLTLLIPAPKPVLRGSERMAA